MLPTHTLRIPFISLMIAATVSGCGRHSYDQSNLERDLLEAVRQGKVTSVRQLLEEGAHIETKDQYGNTALLIAAGCQKGQTALMAAVSADNATEATSVVRLLLSRGANASAKDLRGNTALTMAKKNSYRVAAKLLQGAMAKSR